MYISKRKLKNYGFTLTESLMVVLISSILLVSFYQIIFGSIHFFTDKKNKSDTLETKTPSMELISRYFERWGVGVVTDTSFTTDAQQVANLPNKEKFIKLNTSAAATETDPIVFYANLSGIGFVKSLGAKANLVSCRLDDKLGKNSNGDSCYYVLRNEKIIPSKLDNDLGGTVTGDTKIDSVSFSANNTTDLNRYIKEGLECVSETFSTGPGTANTATSGMKTTNSTIGLTGTIVDSDSASISSTIITGLPTASTFNLAVGDVIFRSPHRIKMYVKPNPFDKYNNVERNWLYVSTTPVASKCRTSTATDEEAEPIAPADSITAIDKPTGNVDTKAVEVTVNFRSEPYRGQPAKVLIVKRIFGV